MVGPGSSPVLYQNLLVLTLDGGDVQFVAALDKVSGKLVWKTPRSGPLRSNPDVKKSFCTPLVTQVDGHDQLINPGADWVYSYEPLTGKEIWRVGYSGFSVVPRPVVGHGLAFICTGFMHAELWAVRLDAQGDVAKSPVTWRYVRHAPLKPSLALVGDELFMVGDTGFLTCLDARTGQKHWEEKLAGNFSASPLAAPGRIYFFSEEGRATVLAPGREFRKLAECEIGERIMASPAVSGNALFLRTDKALYRIESSH
jgi:outer membrane protein assembly factor BamB